MAFTPSYNILDKDTHNTLVEALKSGGIGYTEADGTVHKISDTYASGGGGSSLPEVSAADNGDVLTVVEGEWAKAAPSGGGGVFMTPVDTSWANLDIAVKSGDDVFPIQLALIPDEDFARLGTSFPIAYREGVGSIFIPTEYWGESTTITAASEEEALEAGCVGYYTGSPFTFPVTYNILVEAVSPAAAMTLAPLSMMNHISPVLNNPSEGS